MRDKSGKKRTRALVIGGSIAGMLAARILADHFQEVIIIERDHYALLPHWRSGVPQDRQLHVLLLRGQNILRQLFPQLEEHLLKEGAFSHDYGSQSFYYYRGQFSTKQSLRGWLCSRVLLEWQIRQELITSYPSIHFIEGYEVIGLIGTGSTNPIQGVKMHLRDYTNEVHEQLADIVVDASGANSRAPHWLKDLGYNMPEETLIDASVGYTTRYYSTNKEILRKFIVIQGKGGRRSGSLMQIENGKVVVVLAGAGGDFPDQTNDGYLSFAKSLPTPVLYETIKVLTPLTPIFRYRRTANRLRHYENITTPNNFLVLGDAYCTFNPVYGQGMTVAALEALILAKCLRRRSRKLSTQFHRSVARAIKTPWFLATAVDKSFLEGKTSTEEHSKRSLPRRYLDRITNLLSVDEKVSLTFLRVQHMLRSPLFFLQPLIMLQVLFRRLEEKKDKNPFTTP